MFALSVSVNNKSIESITSEQGWFQITVCQ